MLFYLLFLFIVLPMTELWLLLQLAGAVGWLPTLLIALGTGALGATLARQQGMATLWRIREQSAKGQMPADAVFDGVLILVAAAVLMTPGVLTDAFGFSLLVPPIRAVVKRLLRHWFKKNFRVETNFAGAFSGTAGAHPFGAGADDDVVEGHIVRGRVVEVKTLDVEPTER